MVENKNIQCPSERELPKDCQDQSNKSFNCFLSHSAEWVARVVTLPVGCLPQCRLAFVYIPTSLLMALKCKCLFCGNLISMPDRYVLVA